MKNKLKIILGGVLLLVTSIAVAGIIFVPVGGRYSNPELAPVDFLVQDADGTIRIRTTGLTGRLTLDCSEVEECQSIDNGCAEIPFTQEIELTLDRQTGNIEGRTRGRLDSQPSYEFIAKVQGEATCLPSGVQSCGQIVFDLESRGVFSDRSDPSGVGTLRMQILGSLIRGSNTANWAAFSSRGTFGFALPDDVAEMCSAS